MNGFTSNHHTQCRYPRTARAAISPGPRLMHLSLEEDECWGCLFPVSRRKLWMALRQSATHARSRIS